MNDSSPLPDLSVSLLERAFPRTFLLFGEREKLRIAGEFSAKEGQALGRFPGYLADKKWPRKKEYIPDLARLEYSLRLAALAPEAERSGFEHVTKASEPEWYAAKFRFDAALKVLESDWPLAEIFEAPRAEHVSRHCLLLVFRTEGKPQVHELGENEALLLRSLMLGVPLGRVLERKLGPDFDAMTFHRWIQTGILRAIDWAPVQKFDSINP